MNTLFCWHTHTHIQVSSNGFIFFFEGVEVELEGGVFLFFSGSIKFAFGLQFFIKNKKQKLAFQCSIFALFKTNNERYKNAIHSDAYIHTHSFFQEEMYLIYFWNMKKTKPAMNKKKGKGTSSFYFSIFDFQLFLATRSNRFSSLKFLSVQKKKKKKEKNVFFFFFTFCEIESVVERLSKSRKTLTALTLSVFITRKIP